MENIPHSLPKRRFFSTTDVPFTSHSSVYDDIFSAPSKFALPSLAPRLEDYSEIFGGFHASRTSSIPLLHPPLSADDSGSHFDVRSPGFNYAEVFADIKAFPVTASFQDSFGQCLGGYDSSNDQWSPAQSESLSDELNPLTGSDKKHGLSDVEIQHSLESSCLFDAPYIEPRERNADIVLNAVAHASAISWIGEDMLHVTDDINCSEDFGEIATETNYTKKCFLNPLHGGFHAHVDDLNPSYKHQSSISPRSKPFMTVSDISLRTKPSQLPPPSRPPPAIVIKHKDSFEKMVGAPILSGVKGDDTAFGDSMTNTNDYVIINHDSVEGSIDRRGMCGLYAVQVEEQTDKAVRLNNSTDEKMLCSHGKETMVPALVPEDEMGSRKSTKEILEFPGPVCGNHIADKSAEAVAWTEAAEYFEVNEKKINRQVVNMVEDCDTLKQNMPQGNCRHQWITDFEEFNWNGNSKKFIGSKEAPRWNEGKNPPEMSEEYFDLDGKLQKIKRNTRSNNRKGFHEKVIHRKLSNVYDINKTTENFRQPVDSENLEMIHMEILKQPPKGKVNMSEAEAKLKMETFPKRMDAEEKFLDAQGIEQNTVIPRQNFARVECQRRFDAIEGAEIRDSVKQAENEEMDNPYGRVSEKDSENKLKESHEIRESGIILIKDNKHEESVSEKDSENKLKESHEIRESGIILIKDNKHEESAKNLYRVPGYEEPTVGLCSPEVEKDKTLLTEARKLKVNELMHEEEAVKHAENDKEFNLVLEQELLYGGSGDMSQTECSGLRNRMTVDRTDNEGESCETNGNLNLNRDAGRHELSSLAEDIELIERNENQRELKRNPDSLAFTEGDRLKVFGGGCKLDEATESKFVVKHEINPRQESNPLPFSSEGHRYLTTEPGFVMFETKAGVVSTLEKEKLEEFIIGSEKLKDGNIHISSSSSVDSHHLSKHMADSSLHNSITLSGVLPDKRYSGLEHSHEAVKMNKCEKIEGTQFISKRDDDKGSHCQLIGESPIGERNVEDAPSTVEHCDNAPYPVKMATIQTVERKDKNMKENHVLKGQIGKGTVTKETEIRNDHTKKEEEEREREREREKDRMAVDKVALEAHKRSYAEARERTERAAMERIIAEARLRKLAGRHERFEKSLVENRLRTEQASLERATADNEQQTAEKFSGEKARGDAHYCVGKSGADRFPDFSRSDDTRHRFLSSDLQIRSTLSSNVSYSFALDGPEDSPKRSKARLERYRRTAERAANALAEKNRRDLLAQKEREERNRVAEVLDGEVKRWSNGKEGNLRALLSTLEYILGSDSGWQPVLLTEVITSAAVKKCYKKATLCVHPDKLQQRGATIQQKYICEKVFDLLKEAWQKFNSEEQ